MLPRRSARIHGGSLWLLPPRERLPVSVRGSVLFGCEIIIAQILSPVKTVQKIFLRDFPAAGTRGSGGLALGIIGTLFAAMGILFTWALAAILAAAL